MDPNEALRLVRAHAAQMRVEDETRENGWIGRHVQQGRDLIEAFTALDEWLAKDGFLPTDWKADDEIETEGDERTRPRKFCGCGVMCVWVSGEWQHDAAPALWGDDHDADMPAPTGPGREHWDRIDFVTED